MNWLEFSIDSTPEFVEPIVETLMKFAHGGVSIENQTTYKNNNFLCCVANLDFEKKLPYAY